MRRDAARLRAYNTLLEQIYHKIYTCSQLSGHAPDILFSVPPFILGLPKLELEDCVVYLVFQLRQAGFEVRFTYPNLLYISWKHHESDYFKLQNPIVKAMLQQQKEREEAQTRKMGGAREGKGTVTMRTAMAARIGGPDVLGGSGGGGGGGGGTAAAQRSVSFAPGPADGQGPKQAKEYVPPASFVQQVERPGPQREVKEGNVLADLWSF